MNYSKIYKAILNVFQDCNVNSFPLDCRELLAHYGYQCLPYSKLSSVKRELCMDFSEDAFLFRNVLYYNDNILPNRQRFSFMHELGHIALNHVEHPVLCLEQEANAFASHILAPRTVIHHSGCRNESVVSRIFEITVEAGHYAFADYKRWLRYRTYYKLEALDEAMFQHFYDSNLDCFVWHRKTCLHTKKQCINSLNDCGICKVSQETQTSPYIASQKRPGRSSKRYADPLFLPDGFARAEDFYLYGDMY